MESNCSHPLNVQLPLNLKEVVGKRLKKEKVVQNQICVICGLKRELKEGNGVVIKIYDEELAIAHMSIEEFISLEKANFTKYISDYRRVNNSYQLSDCSLAHKYILQPEFTEGKELQITRSKK